MGVTRAFVVALLQVRSNIENLSSAVDYVTFKFIILKTRVNRPIMKLDGMNVTCVCMWVLKGNSVIKLVMRILNSRYIIYIILKNW